MVVGVELHHQLAGLQIQQVAAMAVVVAEQVQVVAGNVDRASKSRGPEAHQGAPQALKAEFRLVPGGAHQIGALRRLAGHPDLDPFKHPPDADGGKHVVAGPAAIQLSREIAQAVDHVELELPITAKRGDHPKGSQRLRRSPVHRAISAGLPTHSIQQNPLAIEAVEGAKAEIAMAQDVGHLHAALIHALHQGARGGHLMDGVVIDVQGLGQGCPDHVIRAFTGAAAALLQSLPEPLPQLKPDRGGCLEVDRHRSCGGGFGSP